MGFDGTNIDGLLQGATDQGAVRGVAAAVLDRDGVLYDGAFGEAQATTIFRNASMTKAVATVAALQLIEQGRLELDQTVASVLPAFGDLQVLDGFDGDTPILRAPKTQATIRQLMTHTSGLGYFFSSEKLLKYHEVQGIPNPLEGRRAALSVPLANDPGTVWEYGVSVDWLGLVLEEVTGQTLGAYLAEHVWGPLGMTDSTFTLSDEQRSRLSPLYLRTEDGGLEPSPVDLAQEFDWEAGGHGSYGTLADYGRFLRAILRGGELDGARILREETVDLALTDHLQGAPLPDVITSVVPLLANDIPSLPVPQGWGLGFHLVDVDVPGMRSQGTADWAGIFNSYYWIDRSRGVAGLFITQVLPFYDQKIVETFMGLEIATYAQVGAAAPAVA